MILLRTSRGQHLRPLHLLLMLYRYLSGIYQLGDVSALNYVKGYLDAGRRHGSGRRILSVAGHGIGEPELWFADRFPGAEIDSMSFRHLDTQLAQFLRTAGPEGVRRLLADFRALLEPYPHLATLFGDEGLLPYWEDQAEEWAKPGRSTIAVYSDSPRELPEGRLYQIIYVSHSEAYLTPDALASFETHLAADGVIAMLLPARDHLRGERFSESRLVQGARARLNGWLQSRGYAAVRANTAVAPIPDRERAEVIRFTVPAPASAVVVGELLLYSMDEHLSDRLRLNMLNVAIAELNVADEPVREVLELLLVPSGATEPSAASSKRQEARH